MFHRVWDVLFTPRRSHEVGALRGQVAPAVQRAALLRILAFPAGVVSITCDMPALHRALWPRSDCVRIPNTMFQRFQKETPDADRASARCCRLPFDPLIPALCIDPRLSSNLQIPRPELRLSLYPRGRQNERSCTQSIDGRGSTGRAGVPAQSRQGFQPADDDHLLRHSRCRAVVSSPTASMPMSMRPAPRSRRICLIFCCSSRS